MVASGGGPNYNEDTVWFKREVKAGLEITLFSAPHYFFTCQKRNNQTTAPMLSINKLENLEFTPSTNALN
jgi:hypothetical protein